MCRLLVASAGLKGLRGITSSYYLRRWAVYIYLELPFPIILSALWCELCSLLPANVCFDCLRGKKRLSFDERPVSYVTLWHQHTFTWSIFRSMRTHLQHTNRNRRLLLFRGQDEEIVFVSQIIWVKGEQLNKSTRSPHRSAGRIFHAVFDSFSEVDMMINWW